jgi:carboxypeptidase PM20D1
MRRFFLFLMAAGLVLLAVVLYRTLSLRSRQASARPAAILDVDPSQAGAHLSSAVQIKTVSYDNVPPDEAAFQRLHAFLADTFPAVHSTLTREVVNHSSLLYTWRGTDPTLAPIILMGHMDVVPVEENSESAWQHPPFSGDVDEGFIWGRGTLDDKVGVIGILEAAEALLRQNFRPRRTVYLAFGHDEELTGQGGARELSSLLAKRNVAPSVVIDEGGYIVHGLVPGHSGPVAFVNTAEKGYLTVSLRSEGAGGHSAVGSKQNSIDSVSRALARLQDHPFSTRLPASTAATIDWLAPEMPFALKLAMANRWLFGRAIVGQYAADPDTEALVRTTMAATVFRSGIKDNVVPREAEALVNVRLLPGDTVEATLSQIRAIVSDSSIKISASGDAYAAPPEADPHSREFAILAQSIREVSPEALVVPGLMSGTSDSRYYAVLTRNVLRFLPIELGPADVTRIHGVNERIAVDNYRRAIQTDAQLIRNLAQ